MWARDERPVQVVGGESLLPFQPLPWQSNKPSLNLLHPLAFISNQPQERGNFPASRATASCLVWFMPSPTVQTDHGSADKSLLEGLREARSVLWTRSTKPATQSPCPGSKHGLSHHTVTQALPISCHTWLFLPLYFYSCLGGLTFGFVGFDSAQAMCWGAGVLLQVCSTALPILVQAQLGLERVGK